MTATNTVLSALADPETVFKVLEQLGKGRTLALAAAVARVPQDVAAAIAEQHGWPEQHRVRAAWLDLQREREQAAKDKPLLVLPPPDPGATARAHAKAKAVQERDAERFTAPDLPADPTHGRIAPDIQAAVDDLEPRDIGQRVALENTLQSRRDAAAPGPVPAPAPAAPDPVLAVPAPRPDPEPVPEPEPVLEPEPELVCRDAAGTERGYHRHHRAGDKPCTACGEAHAAYTRQQRQTGRPARNPLPEPPADLIPVPIVTGDPAAASLADEWFAEGMRPHLPSLITSLDEMPQPVPATSPPAPAPDLRVEDQVDQAPGDAPASSPAEQDEPEPADVDPALDRALDRFDQLAAAGLIDRLASDLAKAPDGVHQLAPGITLTVALDPMPEPEPAPAGRSAPARTPDPPEPTGQQVRCTVCRRVIRYQTGTAIQALTDHFQQRHQR